MENVGVEWTPGRHTTNTDLRRTAGVGLEGREATSFISSKSKSINLVSPADKGCIISRKVKINNKRNNVEFSLKSLKGENWIRYTLLSKNKPQNPKFNDNRGHHCFGQQSKR